MATNGGIAMTVGKMIRLTFFGFLLAFFATKTDFWWPVAKDTIQGVIHALTTPDPDHA